MRRRACGAPCSHGALQAADSARHSACPLHAGRLRLAFIRQCMEHTRRCRFASVCRRSAGGAPGHRRTALSARRHPGLQYDVGRMQYACVAVRRAGGAHARCVQYGGGCMQDAGVYLRFCVDLSETGPSPARGRRRRTPSQQPLHLSRPPKRRNRKCGAAPSTRSTTTCRSSALVHPLQWGDAPHGCDFMATDATVFFRATPVCGSREGRRRLARSVDAQRAGTREGDGDDEQPSRY